MRATRAYLAGLGTAGALVLGAATLFVVATAIVAFHGWPAGRGGGRPAKQVLTLAAAPQRVVDRLSPIPSDAGTAVDRSHPSATRSATRRPGAGGSRHARTGDSARVGVGVSTRTAPAVGPSRTPVRRIVVTRHHPVTQTGSGATSTSGASAPVVTASAPQQTTSTPTTPTTPTTTTTPTRPSAPTPTIGTPSNPIAPVTGTVGTTVEHLGSTVGSAGSTLGATVSRVGSATPVAPVTTGLGGVVTGVTQGAGSTVTTLGGLLGG